MGNWINCPLGIPTSLGSLYGAGFWPLDGERVLCSDVFILVHLWLVGYMQNIDIVHGTVCSCVRFMEDI